MRLITTGMLMALASTTQAGPLVARQDSSNGSLPLVESYQLRSIIQPSQLTAKANILESFAYNTAERNRQIFTPGHKATYEWLYSEFSQLGDYYTVAYQEFTTEPSTGSLLVDGVELTAEPFTSTPGGTPSGNLGLVQNLGCNAVDFAAVNAGQVALISRGNCTFASKVLLASSAGAVGVVIYNNVDAALGGTLGEADPGFVPAVMISLADGQQLIAEMGNTTKVAALDVVVQQLPTHNVIAQSKGGDQNNVLVLGAHTDSVAAGPGINDNGSGTIALLEIAQQLSNYTINNAVRFGFWSAEEVGLVGSTEYVASLSTEEIDKIALYLNFDMLASPNYVYAIYDGDGSAFNVSGPPGSAAAEKLFEDYFNTQANVSHVATEFDSRSDYAAFAEAGIAVGGLFTGAEGIKTEQEAALFGGTAGVAYDVNYHGAGDNATNVNLEAWTVNTKAIAHAVATYARSFESLGIGKRGVKKRAQRMRRTPRIKDHRKGFKKSV